MKAKSILLVEDNPQDQLLILRALRKVSPSNEVEIVCDGQQALDHLFAETVARLGIYWLATNQPPPEA